MAYIRFKPIKATDYEINDIDISNGQLLFATDTKSIYLDISDEDRITITDIQKIYEWDRVNSKLDTNVFYYIQDSRVIYYYDPTGEWILLTSDPNIDKATVEEIVSVMLSDYYDKEDIDLLLYNLTENIDGKIEEVRGEIIDYQAGDGLLLDEGIFSANNIKIVSSLPPISSAELNNLYILQIEVSKIFEGTGLPEEFQSQEGYNEWKNNGGKAVLLAMDNRTYPFYLYTGIEVNTNEGATEYVVSSNDGTGYYYYYNSVSDRWENQGSTASLQVDDVLVLISDESEAYEIFDTTSIVNKNYDRTIQKEIGLVWLTGNLEYIRTTDVTLYYNTDNNFFDIYDLDKTSGYRYITYIFDGTSYLDFITSTSGAGTDIYQIIERINQLEDDLINYETEAESLFALKEIYGNNAITLNKTEGSSTGSFSISYGSNNTANGVNSVALGSNNTSTENYAVTIGNSNTNSSSGFLIGNSNTVHGTLNASNILGANNDITSTSSFIIGNGNTSVDSSSSNNYVIGATNSLNSSNYSFFVGRGNSVKAGKTLNYGFVIGDDNIVYGSYDYVFGIHNRVKDSYCIALGQNNEVDAYDGVAIGSTNMASYYASAIGYNNTSSGSYSFSGGSNNTASGQNSVALGYYNAATGFQSVALGSNLLASSNYNTVFGKFNEEDDSNTYAIIVGGGTADVSRSNIATLDWSGNASFTGNVTAVDTNSVTHSLVGKQNKLTAGNNITIDPVTDTISVTGGLSLFENEKLVYGEQANTVVIGNNALTLTQGTNYSEYLEFDAVGNEFVVKKAFYALIVAWVLNYQASNVVAAEGRLIINNVIRLAYDSLSDDAGSVGGNTISLQLNVGDRIAVNTPNSSGYSTQRIKIYRIMSVNLENALKAYEFNNNDGATFPSI